MSEELTEKWKQGELPVGEYYLLYKDGTTDREYYDWANVYGRVTEKGFSTDPNDIEKILAPVPSYEKWQEIKEFADYSLHNRYELTRQINFWMDKHTQIENKNQKLKELLLKAKGIIAAYRLSGSIRFYSNEDEECVIQIEQALGIR